MSKNNKRIIRASVNYDLSWSYGVSIEQIKKDIVELEKLGATQVDIEAYVSYDSAYVEIKAIAERLETDEEYQQRIAEEQKRTANIKERELKLLAELKKKYEK